MKKLLIYLILVAYSFNSNAQYSTINIGLTNTSFNDIYNDYDENRTSLNSLRFGFSKSFVTSKWFDTQLNLSYVSGSSTSVNPFESSTSVTPFDSVANEKLNYI